MKRSSVSGAVFDPQNPIFLPQNPNPAALRRSVASPPTSHPGAALPRRRRKRRVAPPFVTSASLSVTSLPRDAAGAASPQRSSPRSAPPPPRPSPPPPAVSPRLPPVWHRRRDVALRPRPRPRLRLRDGGCRARPGAQRRLEAAAGAPQGTGGGGRVPRPCPHRTAPFLVSPLRVPYRRLCYAVFYGPRRVPHIPIIPTSRIPIFFIPYFVTFIPRPRLLPIAVRSVCSVSVPSLSPPVPSMPPCPPHPLHALLSPRLTGSR